MVKRHKGLDLIIPKPGQNLMIVVKCRAVPLSLARLNPPPLQRQPVRVVRKVFVDLKILPPQPEVIARQTRGRNSTSPARGRPVVIFDAAFDLISRRRRAPKKPFWKFAYFCFQHSFEMLPIAV